MPLVDIIDESFIVATAGQVAARLRNPTLWRAWWPDLELTVFQDRGDAGLRWTVTGALVGTSEVWLEPFRDGVIVHYYLRTDPTVRGSATTAVPGHGAGTRRHAAQLARRHAVTFKRNINGLKDELEHGRPVGEPRQAGGVAGSSEAGFSHGSSVPTGVE